MEWEEYEKKCNEIREENKKYLKLFAEDIKGLSPKTVRNHLENMDFYLNEYLLWEDAVSMQDGIHEVCGYLGYFHIRKCPWSTPATLKSSTISLKKFYKCMLDHGLVEKEDYDTLCYVIKENLEEWMDICAAYNDPSEDDPFDIW